MIPNPFFQIIYRKRKSWGGCAEKVDNVEGCN
jgi:hypothetical protein